MATAPEPLAMSADQVCMPCKKHKRRCDKGIPKCGLCDRTGRACEYSVTGALDPPPTAAMFEALRTRLGELEERLHNTTTTLMVDSEISSSALDTSHVVMSNVVGLGHELELSTVSTHLSALPSQQNMEFPALLFLDIDCFNWARLPLPGPSVSIPEDVLAILSQDQVMLDTSAIYFSTIHTWFPIVSKKRMDLGVSLRNGGPDIAMLFLAMKLITAQPEEVANGTLYSVAKEFLASLTGNGGVSLLCLQAMILIALYEYGHSIYPAAWMSTGACARYAEVLGLSCGGMDAASMRKVTTWTEIEERRRVWWAVFILDRVVSMGSRKRCAVADPPSDGKLPVDDKAWEAGDVAHAVSHMVCTNHRVHQSAYARLCQAALFVGRALTCTRDGAAIYSLRVTATMSLAEELCDFSAIMDNVSRLCRTDALFSLLGPRCLARSALFLALDSFTCPEKVVPGTGTSTACGEEHLEELEIQSRSVQMIHRASIQGQILAGELLNTIDSEEALQWQLGKVSPFMFDAMYSSVATLHWLLQENGDEVHVKRLDQIRSLLEMTGSRWRLSKEYITMERFHSGARDSGIL